ncbi:CHC2 zinc finger domain-containing protein [Puniceicoccus vermicola]|uniref:Toprim domain-containing protein n=2 Tax=Puniceicoccus vermicola TaxID=388746 RepID=A0A7X1AW58_9BACT|nr:CHC2 zinc finger domain-containing protein [Puniceicoccus vermicola]MBC2601004.1 toprim domain-containing protein [Puniceicoccus vermicola]
MPRIPETELEDLKRSVDLAALVRSKGVELKKHGSKDLAGLSPFTDEKTPSFIVTPAKNLWHCMSSGQGGSVIDFVMHYDGVSFRQAVELLRTKNPSLYKSAGPVRKSSVPKLPPAVEFDADDQTLFDQVLGYYAKRLHENPSAIDYLKKRGLWNEEAIERFRIGYADRTLGLTLPHKNRKDGAEIRTRLQRLGIYRESGHEHFNGSLVFPVMDEGGAVREIYGRKVGSQKSGIYHLYLPGPHAGIWNPECLKSPEIILTESIIDALTFWVNGFRNVTCIWGTEGFTDEHLEAFRKHRTQKIYLAYDRDKAGDRASERDAERLQSHGIECFRVKFPAGMDSNEYALKVTPPEMSLKAVLSGAEWLPPSPKGYGATGGKGLGHCVPQEGEIPFRVKDQDTRASSSNLLAANLAADAATVGQDIATKGKNASEDELRAFGSSRETSPALKLSGEDYLLDLGPRSYRVRGLQKNGSLEVLKVNLRLVCEDRFHLDTLDFYRSKDREAFVRAAASETTLEPDLIKRDLGKLLLALEQVQEERIRAATEPQPSHPEMTEEEQAEALELLRSPDLLHRILADFESCGIVGESTNKLTGYLACVSRKLDRPLAVIVQSTSAAGKSTLMESILAFIPEEERVKYSAMTGQSLYYLGETNLKNKILAIVEEEGAEKASYALKLLQSEGELTIASTGKDDQGRMKTEEYHVEGPVMIFLTTTAVDIDEELLNRCLVLTVDESREQTKAIHDLQREAETFEGLKRKVERDRILSVHKNAQRLLKPLPVVNPFAKQLTFLSDRTRTRRDHVKYLTLIRTIALLHQHQRPLKEKDGLEYIEATRSDIEEANRIAHEVLGRSLDELPPQTRRLLILLRDMVDSRCREEKVTPDVCLFSRRQVRRFTGWTEFQVRTHLNKLQEMEYILPHYGGRGQSFVYELLFNGEDDGRPQMCGLLDMTTTKTSSIENNGSSMKEAGSSIQRASNEHGSSIWKNGSKPSNQGPSGRNGHQPGENAQEGAENRKAS